MSTEALYCDLCDKPATWARRTQFSGTHSFCEADARKEADFGVSDNSGFFWEEIPADQVAPRHRTEVPEYEGKLDFLCQRLHGMQYDRVAEFYRLAEKELSEQASQDQAKGRVILARLLNEAAGTANVLRALFEDIWERCAPHMPKE